MGIMNSWLAPPPRYIMALWACRRVYLTKIELISAARRFKPQSRPTNTPLGVVGLSREAGTEGKAEQTGNTGNEA